MNVRSYSSVINEENNVKKREQFNLVRSSFRRVKVFLFLANTVLTTDLRIPRRTFHSFLKTKSIKKTGYKRDFTFNSGQLKIVTKK